MKIWLFLLVSLLLVMALGCISAPKGSSDGVTGMAVVDNNPVTKNTTVSKTDISECVKYCLSLNKDSSSRSKTGWYSMSPEFCTKNCPAKGVKCTVVFLQGNVCNVNCAQNNKAFCS